MNLSTRGKRPSYLRVVSASGRAPRVEVRISVNSQREPFGRSRIFRIPPREPRELIAVALQLEARQ